MPLKVIVGSATKDAARAAVYPSTTAKRVNRIEAWNGSAWKLVQSFLTELTASASPSSASGAGGGFSPEVVTTNTVTITPAGGQAPYSYFWTLLEGSGVTIGSPATASTSFSTYLTVGNVATDTARCTVVDSLSSSVTVDVPVSLTNGLI